MSLLCFSSFFNLLAPTAGGAWRTGDWNEVSIPRDEVSQKPIRLLIGW